MEIIIRIVYPIIIFAILYTVAFINNIHYRSSEDFLFISETQWNAILMLMLPTLVAVFMR
jgi:hypothetical protein